jgi:energy-coupling factor transporter ATP-binding protein EcfA2
MSDETQDTEGRGAEVRGFERHVLAGLADELERYLAATADLAEVARRRHTLNELARDAREQLERAHTAAVITLVGSTGAGKSTLLNALVGRPIAREGEDRPTTSAPVIYRPRDAGLGELLDGLPGAAPRIVDYDVDTTSPWTGQVLIDAPDTNSVETGHREVVAALAARSDVLVIVAHRQSIAELSSARFVDLFAGRRGMLFVLNRADELTPVDRTALIAQLQQLAAERYGAARAPVLAVSARVAQRDPTQPDWQRLVQALRELATSEIVGGVRRRNALGAVTRIAGLARELAPVVDRSLVALADTTRAGVAAWRDDVLGAVGERLQHRGRDLSAMLWNDAAKGWDGPGGYALRAGGLATVGLGAGAALARYNPALAAGAAVGALVADRARGALRERSFQSTSGLLPGSGEQERWQRDSLSAARLAAEDSFLVGGVRDGASDTPSDAEARAARLGAVPDAEALGALAVRTVEESWDQLLAVDLPAAARAALPRGVPWIVDGPVYALAAWIVFRAAEGLYRGTYIGVELLATAAIVAGAWLFLCRSVVRRALTARGSRLLAGVRARIEARLRAEEDTLLAEQRGVLHQRQVALARLAEADRTWRERLRA